MRQTKSNTTPEVVNVLCVVLENLKELPIPTVGSHRIHCAQRLAVVPADAAWLGAQTSRTKYGQRPGQTTDEREAASNSPGALRNRECAKGKRDSRLASCLFCPGGASTAEQQKPLKTAFRRWNIHGPHYGVESICRVVQTLRSGYYPACSSARQPALRSMRARQDEAAGSENPTASGMDNMQCLGVVKVWKQLHRERINIRALQRCKG